MRKVPFICLLVVLTTSPAYCEDLMALVNKLESLKTQIHSQINQVQDARDRADERIALARERLYEDLVLAEEELNEQIENARGFLGTMPDKMKEAGEAAKQIGDEWNQAAKSAYSNLEATTKRAQSVLQQLQGVRKSLDQVQTQSTSTTPTTQPNSSGQTQTGGCSSCPTCSGASSGSTTTTQPDTATTTDQPATSGN